MKLKCDKCEKTFERDTLKHTEQALRMHVQRKHGTMRESVLTKKIGNYRIPGSNPLTGTPAPRVGDFPDKPSFKTTYNKWYRANNKEKPRVRDRKSEGDLSRPDRKDFKTSQAFSLAYNRWYRKQPQNKERETKRMASRRGKLKHNHQPTTVIHYCPQCGFNMEVLATALAVVERSQ